jgi:hypothetical protein
VPEARLDTGVLEGKISIVAAGSGFEHNAGVGDRRRLVEDRT